jgi:adenylyltransferase/sulfurtransferase
MRDIAPKELKARLDAGEDIDIIDVREGWEVNIGTLPNAINIPMDDIPESLDKVSRDKPVVIMCHTGRRSEEVTYWLETEGYENVYNLVGGIAQWIRDVDPSIQSY